MCIYILKYGEMLDCGESDRMMKISEKMDKSDTYKMFSCNISQKKFLNKEQNIISQPFVNV